MHSAHAVQAVCTAGMHGRTQAGVKGWVTLLPQRTLHQELEKGNAPRAAHGCGPLEAAQAHLAKPLAQLRAAQRACAQARDGRRLCAPQGRVRVGGGGSGANVGRGQCWA